MPQIGDGSTISEDAQDWAGLVDQADATVWLMLYRLVRCIDQRIAWVDGTVPE